MSAPRPYETHPFHPPALFTLYIKINFYIYIYKTIPLISSMWYIHRLLKHCAFVINACALPKSHILRFGAILKSFVLNVVRIGTRYSETLPLKLDTDAL